MYGLETYGKDLNNKLIRCILYDIRKTMMGMATPLGFVVIPKFNDPAYQQMPEDKWSAYRKKNKYELKRPDFDSMLEETYEMKKDDWIEREKNRDTGYHHEERFKLGEWLRNQKVFQEQDTKAKKRILARQVFRDLTEAEVDEIVTIATMELDLKEIDKVRKKSTKENK